jgi:MFS superfamily sulfate permease-like transporter
VLVLGPDSSVSPLILATITPLLVIGDPESAIALAGMLAVLVGVIEIGLAVAKLGFVADLPSSEVRVGYLNGLAVTIIVGQLPKVEAEILDINTLARNRSLQVALLVPVIAGLLGFANALGMMRLPDLKPSVPLEGMDFG